MNEASTSDRRGLRAWLASFGRQGSAPPGPSGRALELLEASSDSPEVGENSRVRVIFDGALYNRDELRAQLADAPCPELTDADLVSRAYQRWGEDVVARLKGIFALVIEDRPRDLLLCARDPLGIRPLFHADLGGTVLLSPSVDALRGHAGVSPEINRASLVDRLTRHWPAGEETCLTHVRRIPPGHVLRVGTHDRRVYRYWDPLPADGSIQWIADDEVQERFVDLLGRAVMRCVAPGPAGVYVSGGLDSSMLAMVVADLSRKQGWAPPCALSLAFSEADREEPTRQRGLAAALGLFQVQLPFEEAVSPEGTLSAALAMTRSMPAPLTVIWRPALERLALLGREQGCRVVLAGDGADEWLWENPIVAADLLTSLHLVGLYRLWRIYARSYHFSSREAFRLVLWRSGAKQLLRDARDAAVAGLGAPRPPAAAMRAATPPPWVAPDPALRSQLRERLEAACIRDAMGPRPGHYYLRDTRSRLESADKWFREEETFLVGQRTGVPVREPFWDPDLIEFLVRVPPRARSIDGLAKALVRRPLTERFPGLGFEAQRKSNLGLAFMSVLEAQAGAARQAMGGLPTLVDLGVVDRDGVRVLLDDVLGGKSHRDRLGWAWELLNLEAWARAHR
ncbi:MAG TPA: asparagine synthase-related protein [Candidatus Methylomirabilis sp.]|nr:asparagine synthase-related protein [Candidatus Methylomirabilis sp.]